MTQEKVMEILGKVDHTLLAVDATWEQIRAICDDGIKYHTASVCIPASYVKQAAEYVQGKVAVCTVIGFPNGYSTTAVKVFETEDAVKNGADEIDMVVNVGWVKDGRYDQVLDEINEVKKACGGKILKVIIETCLLTDVRGGLRVGCGFHQDLHGIFHRRGDFCGCSANEGAYGAGEEDQGSGRHRKPL